MDALDTSRAARLALAVAVILAGLPAAAGAGDSLAGWTRLQLEGRKFLFASGRSEITRVANACGAGIELVTLESEARVLGARAGRHAAASVQRRSAPEALRWMELSPGKKARLGQVDHCEQGSSVELLKYRPDDRADGQPLAEWREASHDRWELAADGGEPAGASLLDPYGLLARLGGLASAGEGEIVVLSKDGPARLAFATTGHELVELRVRDVDGGGVRRLTARTAIVELAPGGDAAGETVLSMRGRTRLWIDEDSGALVRIEGKHDGAGGVLTLRLTGVGFSSRELPPLEWPGPDERDACGARVARPSLDAASQDS